MKLIILLIGIAIGAFAMYYLHFDSAIIKNQIPSPISNVQLSPEWKWSDSLDAMTAAAGNHQLIFENKELRILKVTVVPGILDPIHTHKGRSIIWVTKTSPILYKVYDYDNSGRMSLKRTDTINVKSDELYKGAWENPEPPHSVENIGKDTFELYRIEYHTRDSTNTF